MVRIPHIDGNLNACAVSATEYSLFASGFPDNTGAATEAENEMIMRVSGKVSRFYVVVVVNTITGGNTTMRSRINNANGNLLITVPASTTGQFSDIVNIDSVSSGDKLSYATTTSSGTAFQFRATANFDSNTSAYITYGIGDGGITEGSSVTVTRIIGITGQAAITGTEGQYQSKMKTPGTFKNLYIRVTSNTKTITSTFISRKNTANGNLTISVGASTSGTFEDNSNTDSIVVDDLYLLQLSLVGAHSGTITCAAFTLGFETTNKKSQLGTSVTQDNTLNAGGVVYRLGGDGDGTEANIQSVINIKAKLSNLIAYINSNTLSLAQPYNLRINGVNGNQSLSITASTTGYFEDAVNSDYVVETDLLSISYGGAGGSGAGTFPTLQFLVENLEGVNTSNLLLMGAG